MAAWKRNRMKIEQAPLLDRDTGKLVKGAVFGTRLQGCRESVTLFFSVFWIVDSRETCKEMLFFG